MNGSTFSPNPGERKKSNHEIKHFVERQSNLKSGGSGSDFFLFFFFFAEEINYLAPIPLFRAKISPQRLSELR